MIQAGLFLVLFVLVGIPLIFLMVALVGAYPIIGFIALPFIVMMIVGSRA